MVRPIVRNPLFLSRKSSEATAEDKATMDDLLDTLRDNRERCVGMAANMIGVSKRIIAVAAGPFFIGMYNPRIISKSGEYEATEGCLSLSGERKCIRYQNIEIEYLNELFQPCQMKYSGWIAQIIQHEIDHCDGILI